MAIIYFMAIAVVADTRLICPFRYAGTAQTFGAGVESLELRVRSGGHPVWEPIEPHDYYTDELLQPVREFLFGEGSDASQVVGFQSNDLLTNVLSGLELWPFQNPYTASGSSKAATPNSPRKKPILSGLELNRRHRAELFVCPNQVGLLCLSLKLGDNLEYDAVLDAVYRLVETHPKKVGILRRPHPSDLSSDEVGTVTSIIPGVRAVAVSELTVGGAQTTVPDLVSMLLPDHQIQFRSGKIHHFTAIRIGIPEGERFSDVDIRFVTSLAQCEESSHAGFGKDVASPKTELLNLHHLHSTATYGSAHVLMDQAGKGSSFNDERQPRVFGKYVIPFLVTLIQRLIFENVSWCASQTLIDLKESNYAEKLTAFRDLDLSFASAVTATSFGLVSGRDVIQRFFESCIDANRVSQARSSARDSVQFLRGVLDSLRRDKTESGQTLLLEQVRDINAENRELQHLAHRFEILIIGIYAVEASRTFSESRAGSRVLESEGIPEWILTVIVSAGAMLLCAQLQLLSSRPVHHTKRPIAIVCYGTVAIFLIAWLFQEHPNEVQKQLVWLFVGGIGALFITKLVVFPLLAHFRSEPAAKKDT